MSTVSKFTDSLKSGMALPPRQPDSICFLDCDLDEWSLDTLEANTAKPRPCLEPVSLSSWGGICEFQPSLCDSLPDLPQRTNRQEARAGSTSESVHYAGVETQAPPSHP